MDWRTRKKKKEKKKKRLSLLFRATILALVMQALSIYFTYGLQCYMPIIILLDQYIMPEVDDNRPRGKIYFFWNVMIRLIVTLITCTYISLSLF